MTWYKAIVRSVEWRIIAFVATFLFFSAQNLPLATVGKYTVGLQVMLFALQALWIRWRG